MSLVPLLPLAGAAVPVAGQLANRLTDGLSGFLKAFAESAAGVASAPSQEGSSGFLSLNQTASDEELLASTQAALQELSKLLRDRFYDAGVDTTQPFSLETDSEGNIVVAGQHSDQAAIEQIFADDPNLANLFHFLGSSFGILRGGQGSTDLNAPPSSLSPTSLQAPLNQSRFSLRVSLDDLEATFR